MKPAIAGLTTDVARLKLAPLPPLRIDPAAGLTPLAVADLAVLNNPDLRARRVALGVAAAQVFAAGILPDPQLTPSFDQPYAGPDRYTAFGFQPSYDLASLIQLADAEAAARFTARQGNLDELWAEWTTAQQARQLAETALANETRAALLRRILVVAADRSARSQQAAARGDSTAAAAAADLAADLDLEAQVAAAEDAAAKARRDLNALVGLTPDVRLPLVEDVAPRGYNRRAIARDLASLPSRRPDLLALQAGYAAQDATLRKAILAEFPLAQIAFNIARDTTPTASLGLSAVMAVPIFNQARGAVRVAEATRAQLRAEYQARLDQAAADVRDAEANLVRAEAEAARLRAETPQLEAMLRPAPAARARGDIDSQTYLGLVQTVVSKEADLQDRELAARMAEIALETDLFAPPMQLGRSS